MTTSCYPWQVLQWEQWLSQCRQGRVPHALLLAGPAGMGKSAFAKQMAQHLLCKEPAAQACGQCNGCHLINAGNHPDLLTISPEESGKNIKIDQIRTMIDALGQTAHRSGYQVVIITPAEALNRAAANALLKTLEEPVGQVVLILVSHQPGLLPATIISRCQWIRFPAAPQAGAWVEAQLRTLNLNPLPDAQIALKMAEDAPLRAVELVKNNYLTLRDQLLAHLVAMNQGGALFASVADCLKQDLKLWVDVFLAVVLDMLRLHIGVPVKMLIHQDCVASLRSLAVGRPATVLAEFLDKLSQARQALLNNQIHLNQQLLVESLLIQWMNKGEGTHAVC